jgi:hypothetical protein
LVHITDSSRRPRHVRKVLPIPEVREVSDLSHSGVNPSCYGPMLKFRCPVSGHRFAPSESTSATFAVQ